MYIRKDDLVRGLRDCADYLARVEFDVSNAFFSGPDFYLFARDRKSFFANTKVMGSCQKVFAEFSVQMKKSFGPVSFALHVGRDSVCEKVKTGVEVLAAEPERIIPAKPERVVDKFEYKCPDSLLKGE